MGSKDYRNRSVIYCRYCDKFLFKTKKEAKKAARSSLPQVHPSLYPCPVNNGWHWGNYKKKRGKDV